MVMENEGEIKKYMDRVNQLKHACRKQYAIG